MTNQTTRRAILVGAASLPALSFPALAAHFKDPAFAAIERHRSARSVYQFSEPVADDVMAARGNEADRALADLLSTRPTTVAGCIAVLRHVDDHLAKFEDEATPLFGNATDPLCSAGAGFLATLAKAMAELA